LTCDYLPIKFGEFYIETGSNTVCRIGEQMGDLFGEPPPSTELAGNELKLDPLFEFVFPRKLVLLEFWPIP